MAAFICIKVINIDENNMTRLIKKYKNRRLYDTETSQYITLDELKQYVVDDLKFNFTTDIDIVIKNMIKKIEKL